MPFGLDLKSIIIGIILGMYALPMLLGMLMSAMSSLNPPKKNAGA